MDDSKIIALYVARAEEAVEQTKARYGSYCRQIALSILNSPEDAEECCNDVLLQAWDSIPPAKPESLKAYLGRITRNLAIHRYEKEHAQKRGGGQIPLILSELEECLPAGDSAEDSLLQSRLTELLNRFLESQSKEKRIVFLRRYWYGASIEEIANSCGLTQSKVKSMLHRMRRRLADLLTKEGYL